MYRTGRAGAGAFTLRIVPVSPDSKPLEGLGEWGCGNENSLRRIGGGKGCLWNKGTSELVLGLEGFGAEKSPGGGIIMGESEMKVRNADLS